MTSPEIRASIDAGARTAVVACGAVEQHGPHLPIFMDAEHGSALAEAVALRMGGALVAPTIRVGCSEHHMAFAGTLSIRAETFEAVCLDYCVSLAHHGFRSICFIPSHGGNYAPLDRMLPRLNAAVASGARVFAFVDLQAQVEIWRRVVEEETGMGDRVGGHADIAESSIMLALHPDLVREAAATPGFRGALTGEVLERLFREGIGAIAPNGVLGDPRGMSAAIGLRCVSATAELLAARFREAIESRGSA